MGIHELKGRLPSAMRISFGLMLLTISILLTADLFGIIPNESKAALDARKRVSETLAIHFTILATNKDMRMMDFSLNKLVERDDDILSAGIRTNGGQLLYQAGNHSRKWIKENTNKSTVTQLVARR